MVAWVLCGFSKLGDCDVGRRDVRVAKAEVDDVSTCLPCLDLQSIDDGKDVWGQVFNSTKVHAANVLTLGAKQRFGFGLTSLT